MGSQVSCTFKKEKPRSIILFRKCLSRCFLPTDYISLKRRHFIRMSFSLFVRLFIASWCSTIKSETVHKTRLLMTEWEDLSIHIFPSIVEIISGSRNEREKKARLNWNNSLLFLTRYIKNISCNLIFYKLLATNFHLPLSQY